MVKYFFIGGICLFWVWVEDWVGFKQEDFVGEREIVGFVMFVKVDMTDC